MASKTSLSPALMKQLRAPLQRASRAFAKAYPGDRVDRQPVHTVYGGAHLFRSDSARKLGDLALRSLELYAPDAASFAGALGLPEQSGLPRIVYSRVVEKLRHEPVEDQRIDFEDGYGVRADPEEDGHALGCADELAKGMKGESLSPFIGIRVKALTPELVERSLRTLDLFVTALVRQTRGKLPGNFVVTLPKVTLVEEVAALTRALASLERTHKLRAKSLQLEVMVETPQVLLDRDGSVPLRELVEAAQGRCVAAHFGTYDYTAALNVTAAHQAMTHPACDFAKHLMQVSLAGSGVALSDGATTVMPVGPHRAEKGGSLTREQIDANREVVHAAWRTSYRNIRHSLVGGFYQGWDLHPAQLPVRYAATYAFFLESLRPVAARLKAFLEKAAQATLVGDTFDDAATGQGLLNFFLRGVACGALTEVDVSAAGLSVEELRTRSFMEILAKRRRS